MGPQKRGSSGYAIASFTSELLSRSTIDMRTELGSWRRCAAATINNAVAALAWAPWVPQNRCNFRKGFWNPWILKKIVK